MSLYKYKLCFLDFETTGTNHFIDEPIQIGAVLLNKDLEVEAEYISNIRIPSNESYDILLNRLDNSSKIHGITYKDIIYAPSQQVVIDKFFEIIGTDYKLINWNVSFDSYFLKKMCYNCNKLHEYDKIDYRNIDLQTIGWTLRLLNYLPDDVRSLNDAANHFFIPREKKHNALDCAYVALEVYKEFIPLMYKALPDQLNQYIGEEN